MSAIDPASRPASEPAATSRRERQKRDRHDRLYRAAIGLFRERDFDAVTVAEIAERADLSKGAFFNYFESKGHVLIRYHHELVYEIVEFGRRLRGRSAMRLFQRLYTELARIFEREGDLGDLIVKRMPLDADLREAERRVAPETQSLYHGFLERGIEAGEVSPDTDLDLVSEVMRDIWISSLRHWVWAGRDHELGPRLRRKVALVFEGIAAT